MGMTMTEGQTFLSMMLEEPDEPAHRNAYSDWLEERDDPRAGMVRRWLDFCERAERECDWKLGEGWDMPASWTRRILESCPEPLRPLGCVLFHRLVMMESPIPWDDVSLWPAGWSSDRCRLVIDRALIAAEWRALGFEMPEMSETISAAEEATTWAAKAAAANSPVSVSEEAIGPLPLSAMERGRPAAVARGAVRSAKALPSQGSSLAALSLAWTVNVATILRDSACVHQLPFSAAWGVAAWVFREIGKGVT